MATPVVTPPSPVEDSASNPADLTPAAAPAAGEPQAAAGAKQVNNSLYVGDLDKDVSEAQLFEIFSQVGPVLSIRVCRDQLSRRSLGYAYVNYNSTIDPQAAQRALDTLNYHEINGRPIRIMWSHRDPSFRKSGIGNVFIKNLDKTIDQKQLHDTFSQFGHILSCKVVMDGNGNSKGYGFVHFETEEGATTAIKAVNGMLLKDKVVFVGPFIKRAQRPDDKDQKYTNLYVRHLHEQVDDDKLMEVFQQFGKITSAAVMKADEDSTNKGFGFVNYEDSDSALQAVEMLSGKEFEGISAPGQVLYVAKAEKKAERLAKLKQQHEELHQQRIAKFEGLNLYIKNLADNVLDDRLREEFSAFGAITSCKVMQDSQNRSRGFGFVCFQTPESANKAVAEMYGRMIDGKPLYVALAQRKEVRRAQLQQNWQQRMAYVTGQRPNQSGFSTAIPYGHPHLIYSPHGMPAPAPDRGLVYPYQQPVPQLNREGRHGRGRPLAMSLQHSSMVPSQGMARGKVRGRGLQNQVLAGPGQRRGGPARMVVGKNFQGRGKVPTNANYLASKTGRGGFQGRGQGPQGAPVPAAMAPPVPMESALVPNGSENNGSGMHAGMEPIQAPAPSQTSLNQNAGGAGDLIGKLAAASPEEQKQMIGERIFHNVAAVQAQYAGKITGMLLEMDNTELLSLLESPKQLQERIEEAIEVLKQANMFSEGQDSAAPLVTA